MYYFLQCLKHNVSITKIITMICDYKFIYLCNDVY